MKEVWKDIVTNNVVLDRYQVNSVGQVYDKVLEKFMRWSDNGGGYKTVALKCVDYGNNTVKICYVHRLVAQHFLENVDNLPQVGHKDHNKENNSVENLYWTTQRQNTRDGIEAGRINAKKRPNTKRLSKEQICQIALLEKANYGVNEIAVMMDFPRTTISSVFNGRSNKELFEFAQEEIASFVDENILVIKDLPKYRKEFSEIIRESIEDVNKTYKLRRSLGCETQFGQRYSQIH